MDAATDRRAHRLTGALPLLVALALAVGVSALLSPWVRHQLAASFSREPSGYAELYFTDESAARACPASDGQLAVAATVRSHFDATRSIPYAVSVTDPDGQRSRVTGAVRPAPGASSAFVAVVRVPEGSAYTVAVDLPGRSERLVLHCAAPVAGR